MQLQLQLCLAVGIAGLTGFSAAATNDDWTTRSVYQVLTDRFARSSDFDAPCEIGSYCGGTWAGIVSQLDYIQNMGFTAVQISPVNENLAGNTMYGQAFHGYWVQNLYALNSNFGTDADLKNLSAELHKRDMYLLVDVVAEDMAYSLGNNNMTSTTVIDYSVFNPFNSADYFNPFCSIDNWDDPTVYQNCWLSVDGVVTPSLQTQNSTVNDMLNSWVKELVSNYSIDGIRIDGAKQAHYEMFQPFISSAGVYAMAEVDDGLANFVCNYQNLTGGLENYPIYYTILAAFTTGDIAAMVTMIDQMRAACPQTQYLATFVENQDNPRFASYTDDMALAANAIAFMILSDGIPKMYYGQEQHLNGTLAPYNRQPLWPTNYSTTAPLYTLTATLNKLRNHAISLSSPYVTSQSQILTTTGTSTYVARKGVNGQHIVAVLSNQGANGGAYTLNIPGAADKGTNLTEVTGCKTVVADDSGAITVDMNNGAAQIFFPTQNMAGSMLCGYDTAVVTTSSATPTSTAPPAATTSKKSGARRNLSVSVYLVLGVLGVISWCWI